MLDTFVVETTPIILTRELDQIFGRRTCDKMTLFREVGYGYVSRPDGEKVTPSWLKEGTYQIESRGRKYEVGFRSAILFHFKYGFKTETMFNSEYFLTKHPFPGNIAYENTL